MMDMGNYTNDSTGARIAWLRKQRKLTGHELAAAVGVKNVYISQIENDHREAGRALLQKLAGVLQTTVGFLLMETDDPEQAAVQTEPPAVYWSEEADKAARLVDAAPPEERARMLAVLQVLAAVAKNETSEASHLISQPPKRANPMQGRLILGEYFGGREERAHP